MKATRIAQIVLALHLFVGSPAFSETFPPEGGDVPVASDDEEAPAARPSKRRSRPARTEDEQMTLEEQAVLREPAASNREEESAPGESGDEPNLLRPKNRKGKMLRPKRGPSSTSNSLSSMRDRYRSRNKRDTGEDVIGRLTLGAGISAVGSSDSTTDASRNEQGLKQNIYLGFQSDLRSFRYVASHIDLYYGVAPTQEIEFTATKTTERRSLQHLGGMGLLQLGYPVAIDNLGFFPHVGIGYGVFRLAQKAQPVNAAVATPTTTTTNSTETRFQSTGLVAELGIEAEPSPGYLIFADYAMSLGASGEVTTVTGIGQVAPITVSSASFMRIRFGGVLPITDEILLGAQLILRSATIQLTTVTEAKQETLSQIVSTIAYRF